VALACRSRVGYFRCSFSFLPKGTVAMRGIVHRPIVEFDSLIDVEGLRRIDEDILNGIARSRSFSFTTYGPGERVIEPVQDPGRPRASNETWNGHCWREMIATGAVVMGMNLTLRAAPNYAKKQDAASCSDMPDYENFPYLRQWIARLPCFREVGRIILFLDQPEQSCRIHRDNEGQAHRMEFLWARLALDKRFFVFDEERGHRHYVKGLTGWFNAADWHGAEPSVKGTYSLRIDGWFTEEFRRHLGVAGVLEY
jgi:hypothetical protein